MVWKFIFKYISLAQFVSSQEGQLLSNLPILHRVPILNTGVYCHVWSNLNLNVRSLVHLVTEKKLIINTRTYIHLLWSCGDVYRARVSSFLSQTKSISIGDDCSGQVVSLSANAIILCCWEKRYDT